MRPLLLFLLFLASSDFVFAQKGLSLTLSGTPSLSIVSDDAIIQPTLATPVLGGQFQLLASWNWAKGWNLSTGVGTVHLREQSRYEFIHFFAGEMEVLRWTEWTYIRLPLLFPTPTLGLECTSWPPYGYLLKPMITPLI